MPPTARDSLATSINEITEPHTLYRQRLDHHQTQMLRQERTHAVTGNSRFLIAISGLVVVLLVFALHWLHPAWLVLPLVLFLALSIWHQRVTRALRRARRAVAYYQRGLERLEGHWETGDPGDRFLDENHPCALDLDLFGSGSLFQRLCTARTRRGGDLLAGWLLNQAPPEEVQARQAAVLAHVYYFQGATP
jgi:hypothetical protein